MYAYGQGAPKDPEQSILWLRRAAEGGDTMAQHCFGIAYEKGEGVAVDIAQAVSWYRKAADQGNADAERALRTLLDSHSMGAIH
jgi:hypothetical protein